MAIEFPGDTWIKMLMDILNESPSYLEAAKNWEGDIVFYIEPGGSLTATVGLYMDLFHGKCRKAYAFERLDQVSPAFKLSGNVGTWKKVMTKKLDPIQAMMTGQLKLSGNMATIMKNVRAAKELVDSCSLIETIFPI
jgi:putative sterol carrier protein